jgi:nudix-type nucleoside diphosphatase (YffH/AdpP family)
LAVAVAGDVMALFGAVDPGEIRRRYGLMEVRGASRLRALDGKAEVRRSAEAGDVRVARRRQPYAHFFAVEEYDLWFRRFDGGESGEINRAAFISGDAVTVLPYDPWRDRVLLIEQFRAGPFARGDDQPWQLEAIAGRIDPGETPEETARREAREEAGIELGELLAVANYYPSPGAKSEFLYSFCALTDLPDGVAGTFGLAEEAEDIRGHLVSFERLMALVETGEAGNAPLILTALWLQRERPRLRAAYSR